MQDDDRTTQNKQKGIKRDPIGQIVKYIDSLFNFKSFKSRIAFTLSFNLLIFLAALILFIHFYTKKISETQAKEDISNISGIISTSLKNIMLAGQADILESFRKNMMEEKHLAELKFHPTNVVANDFKHLEKMISKDEKVRSVIVSEKGFQEDLLIEGAPHIRTFLPVAASEKCTACHISAKPSDVLAVIETTISNEKIKIRHSSFMKSLLFATLIMGFFIVIVLYFVTKETIVNPVSEVTAITEEIAEGRIENVTLEIDSKDEIAELKECFNNIIKGLHGLLVQSDEVGKGILDANLVEEKMRQGLSLEKALSEVQHYKMIESQQRGINLYKGKIGENFREMKSILRMLTVQARAIAQDDLSNLALDMKIKGELGEAFSQMTENLRQLAIVAEKIAEGDLSVKVTVSSKNAVISNAFAKMAENLKILVQQINQTANAVTNSSQGLAQISEQTSQTTTQLSGVVTQISQSTTSIAQNAQVASSSSQNATDFSRKGRELAEKLLSKMQIIQISVSKSKDAIESLGKRSAKIGEIVNVITKIAEQTNLLSLNAAIEAARAGESGRGFAVVADEIRKLAEHSASSAQEIAKLIREVQQETELSVKVTESAANEVEEGGKIMLETDKGLQMILSSVENVNRQIEQIAAAAEELAASTEEASASSEEQTAAIEEVAASAQNLNQTAEKLKSLVMKFKV